MKARWQLRVTKQGSLFDFPTNYFPRTFTYKRDALLRLDEVRRKGGDGVVERVSLSTNDLLKIGKRGGRPPGIADEPDPKS